MGRQKYRRVRRSEIKNDLKEKRKIHHLENKALKKGVLCADLANKGLRGKVVKRKKLQ